MALLMFYGLACLSFFRYRSHGFRSLSIYFLIDYFHFRNYRNISVIFVFDNIISILFLRKKCENEIDLAFYQSFPFVFIPNHGGNHRTRLGKVALTLRIHVKKRLGDTSPSVRGKCAVPPNAHTCVYPKISEKKSRKRCDQ